MAKFYGTEAGTRLFKQSPPPVNMPNVQRGKKKQKQVDDLWQRDSFDRTVDLYHKTRGKVNLI